MSDEVLTIDPETGEILDEENHSIELASPASVNLFGASSPEEVVVRAVAIADALKSVLKDRDLISNIKGKEYPKVEAWTLLGSMLGVFPVVVWTRETEYGWEARVEARTIHGDVVGAAEAQCNRTEKQWGGRDDFTLRAMAQTRATSRAMRGPLGFVVSLAGYEATAAEEMPTGGSTAKRSGVNEKRTSDTWDVAPLAQSGDKGKGRETTAPAETPDVAGGTGESLGEGAEPGPPATVSKDECSHPEASRTGFKIDGKPLPTGFVRCGLCDALTNKQGVFSS